MADIKVLKDKLGNILNPIIPRYERMTKYSTTEVKTGEKWIDGKDIYRRVINIERLPNATTQTITKIDTNWIITDMRGFAYGNGNFQFPIPNTSTENTVEGIQIFVDGNSNLVIRTGTDRSAYSGYIILEYIKN